MVKIATKKSHEKKREKGGDIFWFFFLVLLLIPMKMKMLLYGREVKVSLYWW